MEKSSVKRPSDCRILIVDDEEIIGEMLRDALEPAAYRVITCTQGAKALEYIDKYDFDIVITDLKIPDVSGLQVLEYAKSKDEFTEVIVITGYATLDSVTLAINQGVYSYLLKPLQIAEFLIQVEKAIASRLFHLRSIELMRQSDDFAPDVKMHVQDITSLYYFIRKLMLSLEITEIMRITLDEANRRMGSVLAVISVSMPGVEEVFVMPSQGEIAEAQVIPLLVRFREQVIASTGNRRQTDGEPLPVIFKGRQGAAPDLDDVIPLSVPMMVTDRVLGALTVFVKQPSPPADQSRFLYVYSSIVSSAVDHGYIALQARQQAKTDSLTGIANHRHFHETLDREIARANRHKSVFTLVLLDIDNFKKVNDTYGHQVGDAVLVDVTRRIMTMIRAGDVLSRYGGEEFGLILPDTDLVGAEALADRIRKAIASHPFTFAQREIGYTVSIGLAVYQGTEAVGKDRLIAAADRALYDSKEHGKNRLSIGTIVL
ncbi:MAG: diguanylate cyclase [Chitinispirillaceae bacterium]|nr:diguanylate cyclase [Chitinispirillaceae bacterium]